VLFAVVAVIIVIIIIIILIFWEERTTEMQIPSILKFSDITSNFPTNATFLILTYKRY